MDSGGVAFSGSPLCIQQRTVCEENTGKRAPESISMVDVAGSLRHTDQHWRIIDKLFFR
jgi:hypothetical protein